MISISDLSYFLGDRALYRNSSLHIYSKDKIGLVGLNGTGKSTLLKLINGDLKPDEGSISKSKECTIGYLNQDLLSFISEDPILDVAMEAFSDLLRVKHRMDELAKKMETDYSEKVLDEYSKLQDRFESNNGYSLQASAEEVLEGIGFKTSDLQRPLKEFSGGWRMRVMLAKLLLESPSLLMLDEPTNHLDLPSIQWLENYLSNYSGAVIIVSHDQEFLDKATSKTVEISQQQLNVYSGNYSFYLEEKELRKELQQNAFENQQQKIKQTEKFIERFRAKSTKARQVQSRVKALEKMDRIEEVQDETVDINFSFTLSRPSGKQVMTFDGIQKSYGEKEVIKDATLHILRGDKIALIGANGKGKSTILRIIADTESYNGIRKEGHNLHLSFYAQHQLEALNLNHTILEELMTSGSCKSELELRNLLGCFLFTGDDVHKPIKVLSGGEKSRVALAKTIISQANFLLLDEPTNHLDFFSVDMLVQALNQYEGTFVTVSHNRHFIKSVANKIWYIDGGILKEYLGSYDEFETWLKENDIVLDKPAKPSPIEPVKKEKAKVSNNPEDQKAFKDKQKSIKKLQKEIEDLEKQISGLESEKEKLERELANPDTFSDEEKSTALTSRYEEVKDKLQSTSDTWLVLVDELESSAEE
ncbi:ABC-F family ATP-binding cassette domain-containing protein [Marinigracilibium pacificum]|uniref:ABC-F family ATP-binding cassette domain-containing protein n=1 Tax=Marinigracilibium pacificum TaxID=2729599 RepID=A0A848IY38_9BACT|nr:ABC-F family ATP-binding cassette domain-containing protein [Marinigracilibium pacificum]NMM49207.1 ABC-F family ATP-binding cassette domain-containing protein [Marinigracilibium pacificum]